MDDFSWLVGIMEGEGCFGCYTDGPEVIFASTDIDVVEKVSHLLEKNFTKQKTSGKPCWKVKVKGRKALYIANNLYPYLSQRRKEQVDKMRLWKFKTSYTTEGYIPKPKREISLPVFNYRV